MGGRHLGKTGHQDTITNCISIMKSKRGGSDLECIDFNSCFNEMRKKIIVSRGENKILHFYQTLVTLSLLTHVFYLPQSEHKRERERGLMHG